MNEIFREAFAEGDVQKVAALIAGGADIRYRDENGYDALIDVAYASDVLDDEQLFALLDLLIENGVPATGRSSYGESALWRLSSAVRFASVRRLLDAGADPAELGFTPPDRSRRIRGPGRSGGRARTGRDSGRNGRM